MMKRFKFGLVGLLFGLFGLISFSNAESFVIDCTITTSRKTIGFSFANLGNNTFDYTKCIKISDDFIQFLPSGNSYRQIRTMVSRGSSSSLVVPYFGRFNGIVYTGVVCGIPEGNTYLELYATNTQGSDICVNSGGVIEYEIIDFPFSSGCPECQECQECPEFNTGEVYSGWIKETDIDALWSKCLDMGFTEGNSSGYSTLYINDIWHQSAPFINITIPEEFDWDYNYTGNDTQFDLVISGYNVDNEYIDGIIRTQKFTPDEEDFNNIITQVIPLLIPGLIIILFIWFIFRFIKKLF